MFSSRSSSASVVTTTLSPGTCESRKGTSEAMPVDSALVKNCTPLAGVSPTATGRR